MKTHRNSFTREEALQIRSLLAEKVRSKRDKQILTRRRLRKIGFWISDFTSSTNGFGPADFDALLLSELVSIDPSAASDPQQ
jgi:hypothetical protein